jgi:hypothetical protein
VCAGLNAIPLLEEYRARPRGNAHLLLRSLGALAGQLTNIDAQGAASMAFHADPALLQHDPYRCLPAHHTCLLCRSMFVAGRAQYRIYSHDG